MSIFQQGKTARLAAACAVFLFFGMALVQLLIAMGVLPVTIAWGGSQHILTPKLQLASVAASVILMAFSYIIRKRVQDVPPAPWLKLVSWIIVGCMILNTFGNMASTSPYERLIFTPVTALLAAFCFIVSVSKPDEDCSSLDEPLKKQEEAKG
mmetsp:Transcript_26843/g.79344  ORF Transcript_26843/g.79344 Transcript_26843/m.79344 type:complete len:153 (-) Transcript_26843:271-729(-)